ncbi:MAG: hypothetical protein R3F59_09800 [Myxococcota bacterium]
MLVLFAAMFAPDAHAFSNFCNPNCIEQIVWVETTILPPWLETEDRRVGGLESLEVTVYLTHGDMAATVNGTPLDREHLIWSGRGYSTYRVPAHVGEDVVVTVENLAEEPLEFSIDYRGSNIAP